MYVYLLNICKKSGCKSREDYVNLEFSTFLPSCLEPRLKNTWDKQKLLMCCVAEEVSEI